MTWTINGIDPRTAYGLVMSDVTGWQDDVAEKFPTVAVPGLPGLVRTSATSVVDARRLVGTGTVVGVGSTAAARITDARGKLDALRAALASSSLVVTLADRAGVQLTCDCEGIVVQPGQAQMVADRLSVAISLVATDPYYYDVTPQGIALGSAMPQGTAPVRPVITTAFTGSVASQALSLFKSDNATLVASLTLTAAFVNGDILIVDMAARTVTLNGVSRLDLITAGDFFTLDVVAQGSYATSAWPFVRGSVTGTVSYRRAWR